MRFVKWGMIAVGALTAGGLLAASLFAGGGSANAEGPTDAGSAPAQPSAYEQALAQKLGVSVDQLQATQQSAFDQSVDQRVASGQISAAQGAKLKSLQPGDLRKGRRKRLGGRLKHAVEGVIDAAGKTIGIPSDQVKSSLKSGQSLAQIAAAHNVTADQLKAGLTANVQTQLQTAVGSGKLTQTQATDLMTGFQKRLDQIIQRPGGQHHKAPGTTTTTTPPNTTS